MSSIESGQFSRSCTDKGHDRSVELENRFGIFDGAATAQASKLAAKIFLRHSERRHAPELDHTLRSIHRSIRRRHSFFVAQEVSSQLIKNGQPKEAIKARKFIGLTTGTVTEVRKEPDDTCTLPYAYAGDSPLYMLDREKEQLIKLTESENNDSHPSDASNFLGSPRHHLRQTGQLVLPAAATLVLMTDGVYNGTYWGASEDNISEILSSDTPPYQKASQLVEASSIDDDASAIVIEYRA